MRILVIGSGGQLGTDCMQVLQEGNELTGLDFPEINIASRDSITRAFEIVEPEVVINCGAYTAVDKCETETAAAWSINADGPRHLADISARRNCRLVHISTDYVFDGEKTPPDAYQENDPVNPLSEYGKSKLAGEKDAQAFNPEVLILRTAWLYSAHGPNFLKTMLRLALSDPKREFKVVHDQFGSLTWSHTLARQIALLLEAPVSGVVHATSEGYATWYESACYFLDRLSVPHSLRPCTTAEYLTAARRPGNSILENKVLKQKNLSLFGSWQNEVDQFVERCGEKLLAEARATR